MIIDIYVAAVVDIIEQYRKLLLFISLADFERLSVPADASMQMSD